MSLNRGASLTAHSYDPWAARHLPGKPERERERERERICSCVLCFVFLYFFYFIIIRVSYLGGF